MTTFTTQSAYVSGAICGGLWAPYGELGGSTVNVDLGRERHRFDTRKGLTFRDMLLHVLMEKGGDFQGAEFTADTVIRVERVGRGRNGFRTIHVREREIGQLMGCGDLVNVEVHTSDFMGDDY